MNFQCLAMWHLATLTGIARKQQICFKKSSQENLSSWLMIQLNSTTTCRNHYTIVSPPNFIHNVSGLTLWYVLKINQEILSSGLQTESKPSVIQWPMTELFCPSWISKNATKSSNLFIFMGIISAVKQNYCGITSNQTATEKTLATITFVQFSFRQINLIKLSTKS